MFTLNNDDYLNIIALCEQSSSIQSTRLIKRCQKALAYNDIALRLSGEDRVFLLSLYDDEMDSDAKETLQKIMKKGNIKMNRIPKQRIIFDNYDVSSLFEDAKVWLMEQSEEEEQKEPSEFAIWEEANEISRIDWEYKKERLIEYFAGSPKLIAVGQVGRYNGVFNGGMLFDSFLEFFRTAVEACDYWKLWDENGHLYMKCSHHDGTNLFEVKIMTEAGVDYYERWNYSGSEDKRTEQQVHAAIMKRYSKLPRFAEKVYGCPKAEYEPVTKAGLINTLNSEARSFYSN